MEKHAVIDEKFDQIFIDEQAVDSTLAARAREVFAPEKIRVVAEHPFKDHRGTLSAEEFLLSKRRLWITPFKGQFFKRCPGSRPGLLCCNYFVLNWGSQCDMDCSYCYLQSFLNTPVSILYSNIGDALEELRAFGPELERQKMRIGTGETVDSLSLDPLTLHSRTLIDFFRQRPNWTLEFKTKSANVDQFLDCTHAGNVVVSWSINPPFVIESEEHKTARFDERLNAAQKCLKAGFQIAFHIDPMIHHEGWKANYAFLVRSLAERFRPQDINVISVGALRFQPEQRHLMKERFSRDSLIHRGEMFRSRDGKLRYDAELRSEMFNFILGEFRKISPDWKIFLCMETPETWTHIDKKSPHKDAGIKDLFQPIRL